MTAEKKTAAMQIMHKALERIAKAEYPVASQIAQKALEDASQDWMTADDISAIGHTISH